LSNTGQQYIPDWPIIRVGVGALLVSNFSASRSRSRMMEPVMKAVSTLTREVFR
jgi:hypothetical protein